MHQFIGYIPTNAEAPFFQSIFNKYQNAQGKCKYSFKIFI